MKETSIFVTRCMLLMAAAGWIACSNQDGEPEGSGTTTAAARADHATGTDRAAPIAPAARAAHATDPGSEIVAGPVGAPTPAPVVIAHDDDEEDDHGDDDHDEHLGDDDDDDDGGGGGYGRPDGEPCRRGRGQGHEEHGQGLGVGHETHGQGHGYGHNDCAADVLLTVVKDGSGTGLVTSAPAGIDCGATCSATFGSGETVTLTATPDAGSIFDGWSGACTGTGDCTVTLSADTTVTATFTHVQRLTVVATGSGTGTVTSDPAGIDCGGTCAADYADGTVVTLTAAADAGSRFAGWSGACTGTGSCVVTMSAATEVTATFTQQATLTVFIVGDGVVTSTPAGIDCGLSCTLLVDVPSTYELVATPGAEMILRSWSEPGCAGPTCSVSITGDTTVTATFGFPILTVEPAGTGSGTVTSAPSGIDCGATCSSEYPAGSLITLTPSPAPGDRFDGWTGPCIDPGEEPPIIIGDSCHDGTDGDEDGQFGCADTDCATDTFCTTCGNGVLDADETCDDGNLTPGDGCNASCQVESGFTCRFPGRPCVGTVCEVATVNGAPFLRNNYVEIGLHTNGAFGSYTAQSPLGWHWRSNQLFRELGFVADPEGSNWTHYHGDFFIPGTPEEGFAMVVGSSVYNNNRVSVQTQMPGAMGAPECISNLCGRRDGARVSWHSDQPVGNQVEVQQDFTILDGGVFILIDVYLTNVTANDLTDVYYMRNVDPDNDQSVHGSYVTSNAVLAQPNATDNLAMVRASQDRSGYQSAIALVARDERARVTFGGFSNRDPRNVWNGTGGLSQSGSNVGDVAISIAFKVDIPAGQTVGFRYAYNLESDATDVLTCVVHEDPNLCTVQLDEDTTVTATFSRVTAPLTVTKIGTGDGTITSEPAGIDCGPTCTYDFDRGELVTLTATPAAGSRFAGWSGPCTGTGTCTLSMYGARTVTAQFIQQAELNVVVEGSGSVTSSPSGISCGSLCTLGVDVGTTVFLYATPGPGYAVARWDGAPGCAGSSCAVTVDTNTTVTVVFAPAVTLDVIRDGSGTGTVTALPFGINCGFSCSAQVAIGATVTLTATPAAGSRFDGWTAPCEGPLDANECVITITAATDVFAHFTRLYWLDVVRIGDGDGRVYSDPAGVDCGTTCSAQFPAGTLMTLTPEPAPGSVFAGWGVTETQSYSTVGPVPIPDANTIGARLSLTVPDSFTYTQIVARVDITHTWIGDLRVILLHDNVQVAILHNRSGGSADNIHQTYTLNVAGNASGEWTLWVTDWAGADIGTIDALRLDFSKLVLTPTLDPFELNGDTTVTASFAAAETLTVTRTGTGNGLVTSSPAGIDCGTDCQTAFARGTVVTLTATPAADSTFTGWSGACSGTGTCVVTLDVARNVNADFTLGHALTVEKTGTGTGTVTSSPAGIDCGATCSAILDGPVTLTATAAADSEFVGWSGGGCSGTGTCVVPLTSATLVTAQFDETGPELTITFAGAGGGSVTTVPGVTCDTDCVHMYTTGSVLTVTATPDATSYFVGWSGACTGTGACTITMDTPQSLTATFEIIHYALDVTRSGSGTGTVSSTPSGIDCGGTCSAEFAINTMVTLEAVAAPGSRFGGWTGACSGTGPCTVEMLAAATVDASFIAQQTLTVEVTGDGVVQGPDINCGLDCEATVDRGSVVTLTAFPNEGWVVASWSEPSCSGSTCLVTVDSDRTVGVVFAPEAFLSVTRSGTGTGTITSSPAGVNCGFFCFVSFAEGQVVTLTATPGTNSVFTGWSGACTGTGPCVVTVTGTTTVNANFDFAYRLVVNRAGTGSGTVTSSPAGIDCGSSCSAAFAPSTVVTLTATADASSRFVQWEDGSTSPTRLVTMNSNLTVTAVFAPDYTLTVNKAGSGRGTLYESYFDFTCGTECSGFFAEHISSSIAIHITATPDAESVFVGWSGACSGTGDCDVVMTGDTDITATFSRVHQLTVTLAGAGEGTVTSTSGDINCGTECTATVLEDVTTTLVATPAPGSVFVGWTPSLPGCSGDTCSLSVTSDLTLVATFAPAIALTIEVINGEGVGAVQTSVDLATCTGTCTREYALDASITLTAIPAAGLLEWGGDCSGSGACVVTMDVPRTVTATFRPRYALTVASAGTGVGTVTSAPAGIDCGTTCSALYFENEQVTLTAVPGPVSAFLGWSGACTDAYGPCVVTITGPTSVTALFDPWQDPDLVAVPALPDALPDDEAIYDSDGNQVLAVSGDGEVGLLIDTTPSPGVALGECAFAVAHCVQVGAGDLDQCMFSMQRCATAEPWNEAPCCTNACWDSYRESRRLGTDPVEAFRAALFDVPSCMPGIDPERGIDSAAPVATFRQEMLDLHNSRRALHCVPPLEWSNELEAASYAYAEVLLATGVFEHSPEAIAGEHGENLEFDNIPMMTDTWRADLWYLEIAGYDWDNPGNAIPGFTDPIGHFTQLVWKRNQAVGCGKATGMGLTYLVCKYGPGGNVPGDYARNVLPVCVP